MNAQQVPSMTTNPQSGTRLTGPTSGIMRLASGPASGITKLLACRTDDMECRLRKVVDGGPTAIEERLQQLDREWTVGRATKAFAGVLIVAGLALGLTLSPWWLLLPIAGGAMLVQYTFGRRSLVGDIFNHYGLRTSCQIEHEKMALKALRGDFQHLPTVHQIQDPDAISRMEGEGGIVYDPEDDKVDAGAAVRGAIGAARR